LFPLRGGTGVMGEAGPEAIMPLSRGSDGKLGVRMGGGGSGSVTVNISTPDAQSFRQSQSQVAAMIARAVERGGRNQ
jgi:phage-related minor tail protein